MSTLVIATGRRDLAYIVVSVPEDATKFMAFSDTLGLGRLPLMVDPVSLPEAMAVVGRHFEHSAKVLDHVTAALGPLASAFTGMNTLVEEAATRGRS